MISAYTKKDWNNHTFESVDTYNFSCGHLSSLIDNTLREKSPAMCRWFTCLSTRLKEQSPYIIIQSIDYEIEQHQHMYR